MNEINQKLEELAKIIIFLQNDITWNDKLESFHKAMDIILFIKSQGCVEDRQWLVLRKLTDELLKLGIDKSVIGITQNEYEQLKVNNQLKDNTIYVIIDDND